MLKILDIGQIRQLDEYTIKHEPVASIDLMERACRAFVIWFGRKFDVSKRVGVVCGTGNNGGDGLGIARMLDEAGYLVAVWIVQSPKQSKDFLTNQERLPGKIDLNDFGSETTSFPECDVLIDAIFGSGLTRTAVGIHHEAIQAINNTDAVRIAVDIPSGLFADQHASGPVVNAHFTTTFQVPKLAFLLPENNRYVGEWQIVDIGLDKTFVSQCETQRYYMTRKSAKKLVKPRKLFSHKGDFGHALLVAGSYGKMGAGVLAARGALRAGVGLLTVHVPSCGMSIFQTTVPEAMLSVDPHETIFSRAPSVDAFDVVGIGPGIGQAETSVSAFREILEFGKPMVIDADALNILGAHRELMHLVPVGSILTPHQREFERLVGKSENDFDRLTKQLALASQLKSIVLVKGAHTAIATPEGAVYFNNTGNPGMATGGSGDVLTGILTALLAQGHSAKDAAILGVYLHGLAGDLAAKEKGQHSLIASDLTDFLPVAFKSIS